MKVNNQAIKTHIRKGEYMWSRVKSKPHGDAHEVDGLEQRQVGARRQSLVARQEVESGDGARHTLP